ncbi:DinB family protein [Pseudarthrobacter sp. J1763]|uniref:DinB family protein n=1 Tax=Pseudarthrobacter sp. J1763 TaxID=3420445 RepID=UPI003D26B520
MGITPDTKDWTWVLNEPCDECGFVAQDLTPQSLAATVRDMIPRWEAVLQRPTVAVRPNESTWSPLEYAAHVRDVFELFEQRLSLMLNDDDAHFANWDQDATAIEKDYAHEDPARVANQLRATGSSAADAFEAVRPDQFERTGLRSNGSAFTVVTLAQYFGHDVVHHLKDVDG